jgi:hypothetical protein
LPLRHIVGFVAAVSQTAIVANPRITDFARKRRIHSEGVPPWIAFDAADNTANAKYRVHY